MPSGPDEASTFGKLLEWAWAFVGMLIGVIWKKHNDEIVDIKKNLDQIDENMNAHVKFLDGRIDSVERASVPIATYEQNRKEVRDAQIKTFDQLDRISQSLARIEGKLDR